MTPSENLEQINVDEEIKKIFSLFFDSAPANVRAIDTSRGDDDFRMTFIIETDSHQKYVLKLADNDFTSPDRIAVWQRTADEYRALGYWCPRIFADKEGRFPTVGFRGHSCAAYVEEFAPYRPASDRMEGDEDCSDELYESYKKDIWQMTAKVAAKHFDHAPFPSAYCLFETFCPSDRMDEVLENALSWKEYADALPIEFRETTDRIWKLWTNNRAALEKVYPLLETSVFQADLNPSNILLDDEGRFAGVYDFNLCGRDVFLNYLMRENSGVEGVCAALKAASEYYRFSELEKDTALMMYRCLKPLWWSRVQELKELGDDRAAVRAFLDRTEHDLTAEYDFRSSME